MRIPGITVFARFQARPGHEDRVRRALLEMIAPTLQENANIGYALNASNDDPRLFLLYEQWEDAAGLQRHIKQPHFADMERTLDGALAAPMEVITAR